MNRQSANESVSSRAVDICATILSDVPPQLPLRQEYMSLGFEVVYNAEGVGKKAVQNEAKRAVEEYRTIETIKELRKRRLFPKKYKRIKNTLIERRRIEKELALPHGLSYELYQAELTRLETASCTSCSKSHRSSSERSEIDYQKRRTNWLQRRILKRRERIKKEQLGGTQAIQPPPHTTIPFTFPDFLAPMCDNSDNTRRLGQNATSQLNQNSEPTSNLMKLQQTNGKHPSDSLRNSNVPYQAKMDTKNNPTGIGIVQESSDDESGYERNIQEMHSNPFDTTSSDKSEDSGLNPLDDVGMFPDLLPDVQRSNLQQTQQRLNPVKQNGVVTVNSQIRTDYVSKNETGKGFLAESANWMGESSKRCFDTFAKEICQLVVVEAQVIDVKDKQSNTNHSAMSPIMSAFSDVSPDVYTPGGSPVTKKDSAQFPNHFYFTNANSKDPDGSFQSTQWASIGNQVCGSTAIDLLQAVVMHGSDKDQHHFEEGTSKISNLISNQTNTSCEGQNITGDCRRPDPPMASDSSFVLDATGRFISGHTRFPDPSTSDGHDIDFNNRHTSYVDSPRMPAPSRAFDDVPQNLYPIIFGESTHGGNSAFDPTYATTKAQNGPSDFKSPIEDIEETNRNRVISPRANTLTRCFSKEDAALQVAQLTATAEALQASKDALNELRRTPKYDPPEQTTTPSQPSQPSQPSDNMESLLPSPRTAPTGFQFKSQAKPTALPQPTVQAQPAQAESSKHVQTDPTKLETITAPSNEVAVGGWMHSAKSAIQNITTEVYKVAGIEATEKKLLSSTKSETNTIRKEKPEQVLDLLLSDDSTSTPWGQIPLENLQKEDDDVGTLFAALSTKNPPMLEIERILTVSSELVHARQQHDGRMPLHALCDRGMPDRLTVDVETLTDNLLRDIASYKRLIKLVVTLFPEACLVQDKNGDLPAHLIARGLMQWEAQWYEKVYLQASKEKGATGKTALAITKLYHNMSESVEILLRPIANDSNLCRVPGSMGTILPLHIASIFTASVNTIRLMLEAYPEAASITCDLGILQTFIPDESLPLELHDNLSTDFPKWEIEAKQSSFPEVRWSQSELEQSQDEDCMRRSDLMFAYNPIEPHRFEKARMRRLEARIQFEAKRVVYDSGVKKLNKATELIWIWMCTFREADSQSPTYVNSVKRIVSALPLTAVRFLVSIETTDGKPLLEQANNECLKAIQKRLDTFSKPGTLEDHPDTALADNMTEVTSVQSLSDASGKTEKSLRLAPEFRLQVGKGFVSNLCRLVFNLHEKSHRTSFVILPYKLTLKDGKLRMASQESLVVAAKFAECLLNLTDPRSILQCLNYKAAEFYDCPIYKLPASDTSQLESTARVKSYEEALLSLYDSNEAYFYLLDEATGLPEVLPGDSTYPITLQKPQSAVRTLLPLMMMGMVQMRGEKAISKLANVILDRKVSSIIPSWNEASNELLQLLDEKETNESTLSSELADLKQALVRFRNRSATLKTRQLTGGNDVEWQGQLDFLRELLAQNDPNCENLIRKSENTKKTANLDKDKESIDALSRKLQELSAMHVHVKTNQVRNELEITTTDNGLTSAGDDSDDLRLRKNMISRYSILFDELALESPFADIYKYDSEADLSAGGIQIWNAAKNVWEDVTNELERVEPVSDDPQVTKLKVALAEQARKLVYLSKKVAALKDEERKMSTTVSVEDISTVLEEASIVVSKNDLNEARKLVLRMCDLEERLLHDEIAIQHLALEATMVDQEKDDFKDRYDKQNAENVLKPNPRSPNVNEVVRRQQPPVVNLLEIEPQEIVDLADVSDESDVPISTITFDNRRYALLPSEDKRSLVTERTTAETTQTNTMSSWGNSSPHGAVNSVSPAMMSSRFIAPTQSFDLIDADFVSRRMTFERRTYSFSSSKGAAEIVDVTDMSDVSSYFTSPRRRMFAPNTVRPVEIVDVTDMSVSQQYSTKSHALSGYAMTVATSEVVDICDMSSSYFTDFDMGKPLESRFDRYDPREPPDSVNVFRDEAPPRLNTQILGNTNGSNRRWPVASDRAAANNRFRPPSWSSDEHTPTSTLAIGNSRRRFDLRNSRDDGVLSSTTAVTTNRYDRFRYVGNAGNAGNSGNGTWQSNGRVAANNDLVSAARDVALSPRVVDIDRVITKYTKYPGRQSQLHGSHRYGTRKTAYNAYGINKWGS